MRFEENIETKQKKNSHHSDIHEQRRKISNSGKSNNLRKEKESKKEHRCLNERKTILREQTEEKQ